MGLQVQGRLLTPDNLFFTVGFNLYGILFHVLCMPHAQVMINTDTCLSLFLFIKSNASYEIWSEM